MGLIKLPNLFQYDGPEEENDVQGEVEVTKTANKEFKNKTILVEPRAFSEAQQIADYLKAKNQVVVNFKRVTSDVSKRIMDFLNGIIYAIDGTMQKLGPGIVLCAPKGFEIEGEKTIHVRNFDTAGNYSVALSKTFVFDKAVPQLIVSSPTQSNLITTANITFSGKAWDSYGLKENDSVEIVAKKGDTVEVTIDGEDEAAAKTALEAFFKENF